MPVMGPDEEVADRIVADVGKAKLLDQASLPKLRALLMSGKSRPEDWRFLLESSIAKSKTHGK